MCSPGLVIGGLGLALQVSGQNKQAQATEDAADEKADLLAQNAKLLEHAAEEEIKLGKRKQREFERDLKQFSGTQVAAMGASGVDIGSGTFVDIAADTARFGTVDSLTIRSNSRRKAQNILDKASILDDQSDTASNIGRQTASALRLGSFGTFLTGGASLFNRSRQTSV